MQKAKKRYQEKLEKEQSHIHSLQIEFIVLGFFVLILGFFMLIKEASHYDVVETSRTGTLTTSEDSKE